MTACAHHNNNQDSHVTILVDCENSHPDILYQAHKAVAQSGCIVLGRGFNKHSTMIGKNFQDTLGRLAVMSCLQRRPFNEKN